MRQYFLCGLFVIIICLNSAINGSSCVLLMNDSIDVIKDKVALFFKNNNQQHVVSVLYTVDAEIPLSECEYLVGIKNGSNIDQKTLLQAWEFCRKSQRFVAVSFDIQLTDSGIDLSVQLSVAWIFKKLHLRGVSFGKEAYVQYYQIAPGDPFILNQHVISMEKLLSALKMQGYLNARIVDKIVYNQLKKNVDVMVHMYRGVRFVIRNIICDLDEKYALILRYSEYESIVSFCKKNIVLDLSRKKYHANLLVKKKELLISFLKNYGFFNVKIVIDEVIDKNYDTINLKWNIDLGDRTVFSFLGNSFFSDTSLKLLFYKYGEALLMIPSALLVQDLIDEYKKYGFFNVNIIDKSDNSKNFFIIKEGDRACIELVEIQGIPMEDSQRFVRLFEKKYLKKCPIDSKKINDFTNEIVDFYKSNGFIDCMININYKLLKNNLYALVMNVDLGKRYIIDEIQIVDHDLWLLEGPFKKIYNSYELLPFNPMMIQDQRIWLINRLRQQGYLHAVVKHDVIYGESGMKIIWTIDHGDKTLFGKTIIRGVSVVPLSLLLKEKKYNEYDIWSHEKIQKTIERYRSFGVFNRMYAYGTDNSFNKYQKDVVIVMNDDDHYEIKLRAGFQQISKNFAFKNGSTYKFGGSFIWKNPLCLADQFKIDTDFTLYERKAVFSYKIPWFFMMPITTELQGYFNKYTQPLKSGSRDVLYVASQNGIICALSGNKSAISGGCNIGFEYMSVTNVSQKLAEAINFKTDLIGVKIPYFIIEPNIFIDFLNDKLNPSKGFFSAISLKNMFPLKYNSYFLKCLVDHAFFVPIISSSVFAFRIKVGHIFRQFFSSIMPLDRFYLGGENSMRGYESDSCPPIGNFVDNNDQVQWVPQGGKSMINLNLETRFYIADTQLQGALFQDFGILADNLYELINIKKALASTGFGMRYNTPVGAVRFDIGWKWKKRFQNDISYAWFLTMGQSF